MSEQENPFLDQEDLNSPQDDSKSFPKIPLKPEILEGNSNVETGKQILRDINEITDMIEQNPFVEIDTTDNLSSSCSTDADSDSTTEIFKPENPFEEVLQSPPRLPPRPDGSSYKLVPIRATSINNTKLIENASSSMQGLVSSILQPQNTLIERSGNAGESYTNGDERLAAARKSRDLVVLPDYSNAFRSLPIAEYLPTTNLFLKGLPSCLCFSGYYCVTGLHNVRMWYIPSAENRVTVTLNAEEKVLAVSFVSAIDLELEGKYIWASIDRGELIEIDCVTGTRAAKNLSHSAPITLILKSRSEMYTLDENGSLKIWSSDSEGRISLNSRPRSLRVQSKVCFAVVVDQSVIWTAQPKMIEVYSLDENVPNLLLKKHEVSFGIANITCITFGPELRYILTGHEDGKITVFDADTLEKIKVLQISTYKITSILGVRKHIWVGFGTGKISIFDIDSNGMWIAILEFLAYPSTGVIQLILDDACSTGTSMYSSVMSLSENGHIRIWDGLLINFQIERTLFSRAKEYCTYSPLKINVLTFNIDSRKPSDMDSNREDRECIKRYLETNEADIFVFGFQELVDLENKRVSAKSFLQGSKKKAAALDSKLDQRLKLWKERLLNMFPTSYAIIEVSQLVGLFQCIIAKSSIDIKSSEVKFVKTGLGGYHGNKGSIATRFLIGDSSFCFINCHLAAHQSNVSARNNDIQQILKETVFSKVDSFWERGGDGKMISDYEFTFCNGDMNYRIDLTREEVIMATKAENWPLLWVLIVLIQGNDQLNKQKQSNNSFGLRSFIEAPLEFAPTFKYNRGTNQFDSSDKLRIPAYCDRILHRGNNIIQHSYESLDIKMSDHRPVGATFSVYIKYIDKNLYETIKEHITTQNKLENLRSLERDNIQWLMAIKRISYTDAQNLLNSHSGNIKEAAKCQ